MLQRRGGTIDFWQVGLGPLSFVGLLSQPNLRNSGYWLLDAGKRNRAGRAGACAACCSSSFCKIGRIPRQSSIKHPVSRILDPSSNRGAVENQPHGVAV